jgi:hypothetical protein
MSNSVKNGPIHYYTSTERNATIAAVVEYCVQLGEKQPINRSQASNLIISGEVSVEDKLIADLNFVIPHGTWKFKIRNRNHHLIVHGSSTE